MNKNNNFKKTPILIEEELLYIYINNSNNQKSFIQRNFDKELLITNINPIKNIVAKDSFSKEDFF